MVYTGQKSNIRLRQLWSYCPSLRGDFRCCGLQWTQFTFVWELVLNQLGQFNYFTLFGLSKWISIIQFSIFHLLFPFVSETTMDINFRKSPRWTGGEVNRRWGNWNRWHSGGNVTALTAWSLKWDNLNWNLVNYDWKFGSISSSRPTFFPEVIYIP